MSSCANLMQIVFVGKISSNFFYYFRRIPIVLNQSFLNQIPFIATFLTVKLHPLFSVLIAII